LRREAKKDGLNEDVWFDNVERVAARRIGQETVRYVRNIYKYYIGYKLLLESQQNAAAAKARITGTPAASEASTATPGERSLNKKRKSRDLWLRSPPTSKSP
jgi:membrane-bound lytic murein transglycosylase MltF